MRHDYDLPADWAAMTDAERSRWLTQERAFRQAKRQHTATSERMRHDAERSERRASARAHTINIEAHR